MNFLRSKIAQYKGNPQQQQQPKKPSQSSVNSKQTKTLVFQSIKQWDKQRAQTLHKHIKGTSKFVSVTANNIFCQFRVSQNPVYANQYKIDHNQKQAFKSNSLNNSSFVLMNTHQPGYKESFQLLKQLAIFQSKKDDLVNKRYKNIMEIYKEFADWKERDSEKEILLTAGTNSPHKDVKESKHNEQDNQENNPLDESSVVLLKSNVRYLIDCQLPDTIQQSSKWCQQINKSFHQPSSANPGSDLYILITKFLNATKKQVQKHRQIGRQLLVMNKDFIEREKRRSMKIKNTLSQWVRQDQNANPILLKQLQKQGNQNLIEDYYNLQDLIESDQLQIKDTSIDNYLVNISINQFQRAQQLIVFKADAFYNKKIQTEVIITIDKFCHLRKPNHLDPDFSFMMNKEINFLQQQEFVFKVEKIQKKFLKEAEKEFQFWLEFNVQEDIERLIQVLQDVQWVNLKCI